MAAPQHVLATAKKIHFELLSKGSEVDRSDTRKALHLIFLGQQLASVSPIEAFHFIEYGHRWVRCVNPEFGELKEHLPQSLRDQFLAPYVYAFDSTSFNNAKGGLYEVRYEGENTSFDIAAELRSKVSLRLCPRCDEDEADEVDKSVSVTLEDDEILEFASFMENVAMFLREHFEKKKKLVK